MLWPRDKYIPIWEYVKGEVKIAQNAMPCEEWGVPSTSRSGICTVNDSMLELYRKQRLRWGEVTLQLRQTTPQGGFLPGQAGVQQATLFIQVWRG